MQILNTFDPATTEIMINRIDKIKPDTLPQWGKMNAPQMLAHLNVAYAIAYGDMEAKYNPIAKFMLKLLVKNIVVGDKPYSKNSRTAPAFLIADEREFEKEKSRLIEYIKKTESNGTSYFEGKESASFGKLTAKEWSNMFSKHLDHHLTQFGV
ncbi:MAG: DUF1569 domain-containing protein [Flavobacteriales bacterium]|nr:DUF1569 domain-containing protein [Flavobacteriales bacterium]MCB9198581.1 DUF1569 domain-containing protein [Flavobacteriales bacterium]